MPKAQAGGALILYLRCRLEYVETALELFIIRRTKYYIDSEMITIIVILAQVISLYTTHTHIQT